MAQLQHTGTKFTSINQNYKSEEIMYNTKTATTNNEEFNSSYMPVGINENVFLKEVNVKKSTTNKDFIEFVFSNESGQTVKMSEWKNEKNMWIKTDEDLQARDNQQFGRILQIVKCFYNEIEDKELNSFAEMINWVKGKLEQYINSNLPKNPLRLKVIYDKNGYTTVSTNGIFVEPMSITDSQIKLFKRDLLERPIVADKEPATDPLASSTPVTENNTPVDFSNDDPNALPF